MLNFKLRQIYLEQSQKYLLPLPKLNDQQLRILADRLTDLGYKVRVGARFRASIGSRVLWFDRAGLASSGSDLLDAIAPVIPKLLEAKRQRTTIHDFAQMYYSVARRSKSGLVRFNTRLEAFATWRNLRTSDESGLTPDEALVLRTIIGKVGQTVRVVTDYPNDKARVIQMGRKIYYDSTLPAEEFVSNLRTLGMRNPRNSYPPRNCIFEVGRLSPPSATELRDLSEEIGEWCCYSVPG